MHRIIICFSHPLVSLKNEFCNLKQYIAIYTKILWDLLYFYSAVSFVAAIGFLVFGGRWEFCFDWIIYEYLCNSSVFLITGDSWLLWVNIFSLHLVLIHVSRLFSMLKRFPIESKGRRKKLQEVCQSTSLYVSLIKVAMGKDSILWSLYF